jgi:hypothetical protein
VELDSNSQPVTTTVVHKQRGHVMRMPLGASVEAQLHGDHFIHAQVGWLRKVEWLNGWLVDTS